MSNEARDKRQQDAFIDYVIANPAAQAEWFDAALKAELEAKKATRRVQARTLIEAAELLMNRASNLLLPEMAEMGGDTAADKVYDAMMALRDAVMRLVEE